MAISLLMLFLAIRDGEHRVSSTVELPAARETETRQRVRVATALGVAGGLAAIRPNYCAASIFSTFRIPVFS